MYVGLRSALNLYITNSIVWVLGLEKNIPNIIAMSNSIIDSDIIPKGWHATPDAINSIVR